MTASQTQHDLLVNAAAVLAGLAAALLVKATFAPTLPAPDATDHLLRDPRNAARLQAAVNRFRRGEYETHPLTPPPRTAA